MAATNPSKNGRLRLGTRGSRLALRQAEAFGADLATRHPGLEVEIVPIRTSGDLGRRETLGAFVRELQEAVRRGDVDCALHCLKDLPTRDAEGLTLAATLPREDPRDAAIVRGDGWSALIPGARVGTGSVRRQAQIRAMRSELSCAPLTGNVDTRLGKLVQGEYEAIVLAMAGLIRLGLAGAWDRSPYAALRLEPFAETEMLPAPGQGLLVAEAREADEATHRLLAPLGDVQADRCARAERAFLHAFGGGCSLPVGGLARVREGRIVLRGRVISPDGARRVEDETSFDLETPEAGGAALAEMLLGRGARELLA